MSLIISCSNPTTTPNNKQVQIDSVTWQYLNNPSDRNSGHFDISTTVYYSGSSLQVEDISSLNMITTSIRWGFKAPNFVLMDSLHQIGVTGYSSSLSSNNSVLPLGNFTFGLVLANGFSASKTMTFPAPGSLVTNGKEMVYTEDYSGTVLDSYVRAVSRPKCDSLKKINDTLKVYFSCNDSLIYNGSVWFYDSVGVYIGYTSLFRNTLTQALSPIVNDGLIFYTDSLHENMAEITSANCNFKPSFSFNNIYSLRVIVSDGKQYINNPDIPFSFRAVSLMKYLP